MARETSIDLRVNSNIDDVNKNINETTKNVNKLNEAVDNTDRSFKKVQDSTKELADKSKSSADQVKQIAEGLTGLGDTAGQSLTVVEEGFQLVGIESEALEHTIEKVDQAMRFAEGLEGLSEAGKGIVQFGKMGANAFKTLRGAIISTGIGALVVGIGLLIANFDKLRDMLTGTTDDQKALNETMEDYEDGAKEAIEVTSKVENAFKLAKKGVISKEEALAEYNEQLGDTFGKAKDLEEAEKIYVEKTEAYIEASARRQRAQKLIEMAADEQVKALTASEKDHRKWYEKVVGFVNDAGSAIIDYSTGGLTNLTESSKKINENLKNEREKLEEDTANSNAENLKRLAKNELEGAEIIEDANGIKSDAERKLLEEQKERREKYADNRRAFERALFDEQMESLKDSYEKERAITLEDFRRQREDIMLDENLTSKQKKALIEANKKTENKVLEDMEREHQKVLSDIDSEAEDLRISIIQDEFKRRREEIEKGYQDNLQAILENEEMTEEQKTKMRLLYAEQREHELRALELEENQKTLENQMALAQAKEINAQKDFETAMEYRKQQLELQRELDLSEAGITNEQKLLIEAEYQQALRDLDTETAEHRKELDEKEMEALNQRLDLAQQGLALITEATDFANEIQVASIEKKYARELASAQGNEEALKQIEQRKVEELNKANKRAFNIKKAGDLASATIDGFRAVLSTYAQTPGGPIIKGIAASIAGAFSALNIAKIANSKFEGATFEDTSGSAGGGGAGAGDVISPEFNIVGDSGINQLQGLDQPPVQAYVVSSNVTTAQSLDRNRIENATI